jgi:undecaprenyl-diphosphatase
MFVASASLGTTLHYVILNRVLFARVRPKWFRPDARFSGTSFPSGHALTSMTLAVSALAVLRELRVPHRGWLSAAILLAAGGLGVSRLYLQAHHPSDVVGAWALSAGWTLALARLFHRN